MGGEGACPGAGAGLRNRVKLNISTMPSSNNNIIVIMPEDPTPVLGGDVSLLELIGSHYLVLDLVLRRAPRGGRDRHGSNHGRGNHPCDPPDDAPAMRAEAACDRIIAHWYRIRRMSGGCRGALSQPVFWPKK